MPYHFCKFRQIIIIVESSRLSARSTSLGDYGLMCFAGSFRARFPGTPDIVDVTLPRLAVFECTNLLHTFCYTDFLEPLLIWLDVSTTHVKNMPLSDYLTAANYKCPGCTCLRTGDVPALLAWATVPIVTQTSSLQTLCLCQSPRKTSLITP